MCGHNYLFSFLKIWMIDATVDLPRFSHHKSMIYHMVNYCFLYLIWEIPRAPFPLVSNPTATLADTPSSSGFTLSALSFTSSLPDLLYFSPTTVNSPLVSFIHDQGLMGDWTIEQFALAHLRSRLMQLQWLPFCCKQTLWFWSTRLIQFNFVWNVETCI